MDRAEQIGGVAELMLDYVEHKKTFLTERPMVVPTRSYTDPDQWKAKMELIFKRLPLLLAFTAEMPNPGDYKARDAAGMPVLINREKADKVRAFLNVCAHRGAPVASDGHGNCPRFTCKYHGWTYGADGKRIGISEASKFGEIDKSERGLRELPCEERALPLTDLYRALPAGIPLSVELRSKRLREEYPDVAARSRAHAVATATRRWLGTLA